MLDEKLKETLQCVAAYYDRRIVGDVGFLGFRRSTRLGALVDSLDRLIEGGILVPGESRFLDLGCGDGRVNVFFSYLVKVSAGIEIDESTLEEWRPLMEGLQGTLQSRDLPLPPDNRWLLHGDSLGEKVYEELQAKTSLRFEAFDLFFTFLTLHEELAERIARKGKKGAVFMIYGLDAILPRYGGLELLREESCLPNKLALYRKG